MYTGSEESSLYPADDLAPNGARPSAGAVLRSEYAVKHVSIMVYLVIKDFEFIFLLDQVTFFKMALESFHEWHGT